MPVSFLKFKDRAKSSKGFWIKLVENSKLILYTCILTCQRNAGKSDSFMPVSFLKFKDRAKSSKGFWIKLVENSKLILYTYKIMP